MIQKLNSQSGGRKGKKEKFSKAKGMTEEELIEEQRRLFESAKNYINEEQE